MSKRRWVELKICQTISCSAPVGRAHRPSSPTATASRAAAMEDEERRRKLEAGRAKVGHAHARTRTEEGGGGPVILAPGPLLPGPGCHSRSLPRSAPAGRPSAGIGLSTMLTLPWPVGEGIIDTLHPPPSPRGRISSSCRFSRLSCSDVPAFVCRTRSTLDLLAKLNWWPCLTLPQRPGA
ncbi:hypothetical protein AOLI_G00189310 [Acnodon oligacanthus]